MTKVTAGDASGHFLAAADLPTFELRSFSTGSKAETHRDWEIQMRNALLLTALIGSLAFSGAAFAASSPKPREVHQGHATIDRSDDGVIAAINEKSGTITLTDGQTYAVPSTSDLASLKTGDRVSVSYTDYIEQNRIVVNTVREL
jgi:hypothetical protein